MDIIASSIGRSISKVFVAAATLGAGAAAGGQTLVNLDFESGVTGADRVVTAGAGQTISVVDGAGVGGSRGLVVQDAPTAGGPEIFWNLQPDTSPVTAATGTGVIRMSYDHWIPSTAAGIDRMWAILTYSNASGAQYRALGTVESAHGADGLQFFNARNGVAGSVTPLASALATATFRRIDYFIDLNDIDTTLLTRVFGRVILSDGSASLGVGASNNHTAPGGAYTQRQAAALQIFSSTGTSNFQVFDNLRVGVVTADEIDQVQQDIALGVYHARSDFNNSNTLDASDATVLVETILKTRAGDANLDRRVDVTDLGILATNWQSGVGGWARGDFNGDGLVDVSDLGALASSWQFGVPTPTAPSFEQSLAAVGLSVIPEPASLSLLALGALTLRRRA